MKMKYRKYAFLFLATLVSFLIFINTVFKKPILSVLLAGLSFSAFLFLTLTAIKKANEVNEN